MTAKIKRRTNDKKKRSVLYVLQDAYRQGDAVFKDAAKTFKISCTKGCADCCMLLATITLLEAIPIAKWVAGQPNWREWAAKLREASKDSNYPGINKINFFLKKIPCVFLSKEKTCLVYAERPACCRYHNSVSDPILCSPDASPDTQIASINMTQIKDPITMLGLKFCLDANLEETIGPLPLMVARAWLLLEDKGRRRELEELMAGLPDPDEWIENARDSIAAEGDGVTHRGFVTAHDDGTMEFS